MKPEEIKEMVGLDAEKFEARLEELKNQNDRYRVMWARAKELDAVAFECPTCGKVVVIEEEGQDARYHKGCTPMARAIIYKLIELDLITEETCEMFDDRETGGKGYEKILNALEEEIREQASGWMCEDCDEKGEGGDHEPMHNEGYD